MNEIHVGDVVVLNSGGPRMVVKDFFGRLEDAGDTRVVICAWIAADGRTMEHTFPLVCVKPWVGSEKES